MEHKEFDAKWETVASVLCLAADSRVNMGAGVFATAREDLDALDDMHYAILEELDNVTNDRDRLSDDLSDCEEVLGEKKAEVANLNELLQATHRMNDKHWAQLCAANAHNGILINELRALREQCYNLSADMVDAQLKAEGLEQSNGELRAVNVDILHKLDDRDETIRMLRDQLACKVAIINAMDVEVPDRVLLQLIPA